MRYLTPCHEYEDLGGGKHRLTANPRPIAYRDGGILRRIVSDFVDSGDSARPHIVTAAPMLVSVAPDGMGRIHPTRDLNRYLEIGIPYVKSVGAWVKVPFANASRHGNTITWSRAEADLSVVFGGHFINIGEIKLKGGYVPPNGQFAFPVGLTGLTRSGNQILADGVPVLSFRAPVVYDADNPQDVRPIASQFVQVGEQWYVLFTLPDLAGMTSPIVDPTFTSTQTNVDSDTWLQKASPTYNYGAHAQMIVGGDASNNSPIRGLLLIDCIGADKVPAGSTISSAQLTLYCESEANASDQSISVHRGLVQFFEGVKSGSAPGAGEDGSTWNLRNANGAVAWGAAGGLADTDYASVATNSQTITGAGASYTWDIATDVQAWADGTANNGLWVIAPNENTQNSRKRFTSSDGSTAGNRPKLVVEYTVPVDSAFIRAPFFGRF